METLIVKQNSNESINGNVVFRVLQNRNRLDSKRSQTLSDANARLEVLKGIFQYSKWDIVVEVEN